MDKIKCPHCGAVNQDVTAQDNCWNCGKPLGASAAPTPSAAVTSETGADSAGDAGGLKLKAQPTLEERVAARKVERLAARRVNPAVVLLVVLLLIALAALLYYFVLRPR